MQAEGGLRCGIRVGQGPNLAARGRPCNSFRFGSTGNGRCSTVSATK